MPRAGLAAAILAALGAAAVLALGASGGGAATRPTVVSTATTSLGRILVDTRGHTVYLFQKDRRNTSACTGRCAAFWPPLFAAGKPLAKGGVNRFLLGTTRRADGRLQLTYQRHPLYTFSLDRTSGQTNGEGVQAFGGAWYAVSPAGAAVDEDATGGRASAPARAAAEGGSGY